MSGPSPLLLVFISLGYLSRKCTFEADRGPVRQSGGVVAVLAVMLTCSALWMLATRFVT